MKKTRFLAPALGALAMMLAVQDASRVRAQVQGYGEAPDKRLDRLEKQLREVRDIVLQAHATGAPVEIKEAGPDPQVLALTSRFDDMDQSLRRLTGEIETLEHDLGIARQDAGDAKAQAAALSARLDKVEQQLAAVAPAGPQGPQAQVGPDGGLAGQAAGGAPPPGPQVDAKTAYANARQLLLDGDYKSASAAFQDYVDHFPDTASARPARYWLGETKYIQEDYAGAATAYLGAIRGWPQTQWAPDAVVKLSLSLAQLNKPKEACGALSEFARRYPAASPAAKDRAARPSRKASCVTPTAPARRRSRLPPGGFRAGRLIAASSAPIVVAFSGGGDSLAALIVTKAWADRVGRPVLALIVDHGLQPQSAGLDRFRGGDRRAAGRRLSRPGLGR